MERENLATFPSRKRKSALNGDKNKYYDYHKNHGHDIEECIHLKEKIENLFCQGHLKNFVQRQDKKKKFKKKDNRNQSCNNNSRTNNFQRRNQKERPRKNQRNKQR